MDNIKEKIENTRSELNLLIEANEFNAHNILEMSRELDKLILQYFVQQGKDKLSMNLGNVAYI